VKLVLTGVLIVLLFIGVIFRRKKEAETKSSLAIYTLCFLAIVSLGYFGGQLVFEGEGRPEKVPIRFLAGEKLFAANRSDCHPRGGDSLNAPQLGNFKKFLTLLRTPPGKYASLSSRTNFGPEGNATLSLPGPVKRSTEKIGAGHTKSSSAWANRSCNSCSS
jgi:hypothetical protein